VKKRAEESLSGIDGARNPHRDQGTLLGLFCRLAEGQRLIRLAAVGRLLVRTAGGAAVGK